MYGWGRREAAAAAAANITKMYYVYFLVTNLIYIMDEAGYKTALL